MKEKFREWFTYRRLAFLGIAALTLSLVPLLVMAFYNHPSSDDINYGVECARVIREGGSFPDVLAAAQARVDMYYHYWQGTFSACFLMCLHPGVFGDQFYCVTTFLMLGSLIFSTFFFLKAVCVKLLGMETSHWLVVSCAVSFFSIQFAPSALESFYWFNGAVFYTFFHALALCLYAFVIKLFLASTPRALVGDLIGGCLLAAVIGGGNYPTALLTTVVLLFAAVWSWVRKTSLPKRLGLIAFLILEANGFRISILAPGNARRQTYFETRPTALGAIFMALQEAYAHVAEYLTVPFLLMLLALAPIFCRCASRLSFRFPLPVLAPLAAICILGVLMTPPLYAMNITGPARMQDMYYYAFCLLAAGVTFYCCGWAVHRFDSGLLGELRKRSGASWALLSVSLLLTAGLLCIPSAEENANSVMAFVSLREHEAQVFHKEMEARLELYRDPEIRDVVVEPLTVRPEMLFPPNKPDVKEDPESGFNKLLCDIYGKDSIRMKKE